ncbi:MAG: peptidoglycan DD-metalloendopeptidase family protein, partial [Bacteroidota bacterium]
YGFSLDGMQVSQAKFIANENLSEVLMRYGVSAQTIAKIGSLPRESFNVRSLQANKPYTVIHSLDSNQTDCTFIYHPNPIDYVALNLSDSVSVIRGQNPVDTLENSVSGVISTSLYESIIDAGGSPLLVNKLADVYAWAIDFFGLQAGDCYKLVYDSYQVDGEAAGLGEIKTAVFTHNSHDVYAFAFDQGEGNEYFDEKGNSLRKTFLKAPLQFSRISSRFSYSRLHPILKIRRPHLGVDYAAPRGTPVYAVGDGTVISIGYSGGAGKMIKIKHNGNFMTAYLHLNGYARGLKKGKSVKQGELIGYVGSTGLSTGPHLDFRFYKNGRPVDPLKIDPPSSKPIDPDCGEEYKARMQQYMQKLQAIPDNVTTTLVSGQSYGPDTNTTLN